MIEMRNFSFLDSIDPGLFCAPRRSFLHRYNYVKYTKQVVQTILVMLDFEKTGF